MFKASFQRIAAVLAPLACLAIALGLILSQYFRGRSVAQELKQTRDSVTLVKQLISDLNGQPLINKVASVAKSPDEQSLFLDQLRRDAGTSKVELTRYSIVAARAPRPSNSVQQTQPTAPVGPQELISNIEIAGEYGNVRRFLYSLVHAERLLNMTDVKWERGEAAKPNQTKVTFTLTRYVSEQGSLNPARTASLTGDQQG